MNNTNMNYKLETHAGNTINKVAEKAKEIAKTQNVTVEFDFNGITCLVNNETVTDWLVRDYMNAHTMEWKTVGPDCDMDYDEDTEIELRTRQLNQANKRKKEVEEMRKKDALEKAAIDAEVSGMEVELIPGKEAEYAEYVANNSKDGYSRAVIDYSEYWAKLMQIEIAKGVPVIECAEATSHRMGFMGITGFMYGCAVNGLAHYWKHGEYLRKWHNKEWGVSEDKEGVVNPAVFTIG